MILLTSGYFCYVEDQNQSSVVTISIMFCGRPNNSLGLSKMLNLEKIKNDKMKTVNGS